jgi:Transmembrane secretion effector
MPVGKLHRNRDFVLLQAGQLLSALGSSFTTIAYPLLVLELTGSPAKAGLVSCARYLPAPAVGLFAGVAADRFDRKRVMIAADTVRAVAIGALAVLVAVNPVFWPIPLIAFVEGAGDSFFGSAQTGALRAVVPMEQLAAAVSVQQGRIATVGLAGQPLGGALFGLARFLPFAADSVSYTFSTISLLAMRQPFQEPRTGSRGRLRDELAEGFRFLWQEPFIRVTSFLYAVGNFTDPAALFVLVVVARSAGFPPGQIGLMLAAFSAALLVGATISPPVRRRLSGAGIIRLEQYCTVLLGAYVVVPSVYVLLASVIPLGLAIPITDSVVVTRRLRIVPDALIGRVESVRATIARLAAPLGPLFAGLLLSAVSARQTMAVFAAIGVGLAVWATFSRTIRD